MKKEIDYIIESKDNSVFADMRTSVYSHPPFPVYNYAVYFHNENMQNIEDIKSTADKILSEKGKFGESVRDTRRMVIYLDVYKDSNWFIKLIEEFRKYDFVKEIFVHISYMLDEYKLHDLAQNCTGIYIADLDKNWKNLPTNCHVVKNRHKTLPVGLKELELEYFLRNRDKYEWVTKNSSRVRLSKMTDEHLINTIKMIHRNMKKEYEEDDIDFLLSEAGLMDPHDCE